MATTFADLLTAVEDLSPSQISAAVAGRVVNRAYFHVLRLRPWMGLNKTFTFATVADKTAGTITLTSGSAAVTGVGTAFASTDVGRYLYVGRREPLRVSAFVSATALTLQDAWGETTASAQTYLLTSLRIAQPTDCDRVLRIVGPVGVLESRGKKLLDYIDPVMSQRGTPVSFQQVETIAGIQEIELWPVSNGNETFTEQYRMATPVLSGVLVPVINPEAVQWLAMAGMAQILHARTGEASWLQLAQTYGAAYQDVLGPMIAEDRRMRGASPVVYDIDSAISPSDPSVVGAWRFWNAIGMTTVA